MKRVAATIIALLLLGCMVGIKGRLTKRSAQRALAEMLQARSFDEKTIPASADWLLQNLQQKGVTVDAGGFFDPARSGFPIDLAGKRFQFREGLLGFVGEFKYENGRWKAEVTGRIAICI